MTRQMNSRASAGVNARKVRESWVVSDIARRRWHSAPGAVDFAREHWGDGTDLKSGWIDTFQFATLSGRIERDLCSRGTTRICLKEFAAFDSELQPCLPLPLLPSKGARPLYSTSSA